MKKFLIETHCHTDETSNCAKMPAADMVKLYHSKGYDAIVISDHLHNYTFRTLKKTIPEPTWDEKVNYFLKGYREAVREAEKYDNFKVYLGAELRFDENDNDYLLFGLSEEKLYKMDGIIEMKPSKGLELIHGLDCVIIQAHPFRDDCVILEPGLCDGIEVYNGHTTDSRNDIALAWAERFNYKMTAGSDFHGGEINAGILTDVLPENESELRDLIYSGNFELKIHE